MRAFVRVRAMMNFSNESHLIINQKVKVISHSLEGKSQRTISLFIYLIAQQKKKKDTKDTSDSRAQSKKRAHVKSGNENFCKQNWYKYGKHWLEFQQLLC